MSLASAHEARDERWDIPLDTLPLPTRMENLAHARGWQRLRDLLEHHPSSLATLRNIGRGTLLQTNRVIESTLGMSWSDAYETLSPISSHTAQPDADSPSARWTQLRAHPRIDDLPPLARLDLPTRMKTFAKRVELTHARELVQRSFESLLAEKNLGRTSVTQTLRTLEHALAADPSADPIAVAAHWKSALVLGLRALKHANERLVLTQRAGLHGPIPTLQELGEMLGVSRERVRQLEASALARLRERFGDMPWHRALVEQLQVPWLPLAELSFSNDFWQLEEEDEDALRFLFNEVLCGPLRVVVRDGVAWLSRLQEDELEAIERRFVAAARALTWPIPIADAPRALAEPAGLSEEHTTLLLREHEHELVREGDRFTGFGGKREDLVRAYLRGRGEPVSRDELEKSCGRGPLPDDVIVIDRGILTLAEQIPDWNRWAERAATFATRTITQQGAERQWGAHELMPLFAASAELPAWVNPTALASLLRHGAAARDDLRYLGRGVVALNDLGEERAHLADTMQSLLLDAGEPIPEMSLRDLLLARRSVTDLSWNMTRMRAPFVLFDDKRIGLAPRDVPGGELAIEAAVSRLRAHLEESGVPSTADEAWSVVRSSSTEAARWDARLTRSILRLSAEFRMTPRGPVSLPEWEELPASEDPSNTPQVEIVESPTGDLTAWFDEVPEIAVGSLLALIADDIPPQLEQIEAWRTHLLRAAESNPVIERAQVRALATHAEQLLQRAEQTDDLQRRRLLHAAVRYLLCEDDGKGDLLIGGLDDDEAVLEVIDRLCAAAVR